MINSLSIVLKSCARSILDVDTYTSHTPLFKKLDWLQFSLYLSYRRCLITFRAIDDLVPSYIKNMFSEVHATKTHSMASRTPRSNLYLPNQIYPYSKAHLLTKLLSCSIL